MSALHGSTIAGFPNLFLIIGPNTGLGHTSMIFMIESHVRYVSDAIRQILVRGLSSVHPRRRAQDEYNVAVQRQLAPSVWNSGGCRSWYLDARGHNTTLWPGLHLPLPAPDPAHRSGGVRDRAGADRDGVRKGFDVKQLARQGRGYHRGRLRHRPRVGGGPGRAGPATGPVRRGCGRVDRDGRAVRRHRAGPTSSTFVTRAAVQAWADQVAERLRRRAPRREQRRCLVDRQRCRHRPRRPGLGDGRGFLGRRPRHQGLSAAPDRRR